MNTQEQLDEAAKKGDPEKIEPLLKTKPEADPTPPLKWAAFNGNTEACELLLNHGADVATDDNYPIRWAAANGYPDTCELLLNRGADITTLDNDPLSWAHKYNHRSTCQVLLKYYKSQDLQQLLKNKDRYPYELILVELQSRKIRSANKIREDEPEIPI